MSNNITGTPEQKKPRVESRWDQQQTKKLRPQPTKINSFMSGPSDARPTGVQLKREAKLLNVTGLSAKHADYRIIISPTEGEGDIFFLVRILLASALASASVSASASA